MRTQDNLRAGMSPGEASRDAEQRFGDFEANRRACRKITLGPRLMLQHLKTGLLVVLIGAVIYQGVLLLKLQNASRHEIEALTQRIEQLQTAREPVRDEAAVIPYVQWNHELPREIAAVDDGANTDELAGWNTTDNPLQQPWSDWLLVDAPSESY
jgi:hypothetical protein